MTARMEASEAENFDLDQRCAQADERLGHALSMAECREVDILARVNVLIEVLKLSPSNFKDLDVALGGLHELATLAGSIQKGVFERVAAERDGLHSAQTLSSPLSSPEIADDMLDNISQSPRKDRADGVATRPVSQTNTTTTTATEAVPVYNTLSPSRPSLDPHNCRSGDVVAVGNLHTMPDSQDRKTVHPHQKPKRKATRNINGSLTDLSTAQQIQTTTPDGQINQTTVELSMVTTTTSAYGQKLIQIPTATPIRKSHSRAKSSAIVSQFGHPYGLGASRSSPLGNTNDLFPPTPVPSSRDLFDPKVRQEEQQQQQKSSEGRRLNSSYGLEQQNPVVSLGVGMVTDSHKHGANSAKPRSRDQPARGSFATVHVSRSMRGAVTSHTKGTDVARRRSTTRTGPAGTQSAEGDNRPLPQQEVRIPIVPKSILKDTTGRKRTAAAAGLNPVQRPPASLREISQLGPILPDTQSPSQGARPRAGGNKRRKTKGPGMVFWPPSTNYADHVLDKFQRRFSQELH